MFGLKMPLRAISIMPLEKVHPKSTPAPATNMMRLYEAALQPKAELKKLTASLLTPTKRSNAARIIRKIVTPNKKLST